MKIDECPYTPQENDLVNDGYELPAEASIPTPPHWAKGYFTQPGFSFMEAKYFKDKPGLETLSHDLHLQIDQQTNFAITPGQGQALLNYIEECEKGI